MILPCLVDQPHDMLDHLGPPCPLLASTLPPTHPPTHPSTPQAALKRLLSDSDDVIKADVAPLIKTVVATNKFEREMAARFGGGSLEDEEEGMQVREAREEGGGSKGGRKDEEEGLQVREAEGVGTPLGAAAGSSNSSRGGSCRGSDINSGGIWQQAGNGCGAVDT